MSNDDIDLMINTLNQLTVTGEDNMARVLAVIRFLRAHKDMEVQQDGHD